MLAFSLVTVPYSTDPPSTSAMISFARPSLPSARVNPATVKLPAAMTVSASVKLADAFSARDPNAVTR